MLTVKDLVTDLGVAEATVLRHAKAWRGFKVGREWRFPFDSTKELAEFLRVVQNGGQEVPNAT